MSARDEALLSLIREWMDEARAWYWRADSMDREARAFRSERYFVWIALEVARSKARSAAQLARACELLDFCPLDVRMVDGWLRHGG